ncbi:MAG: UDP-N-acetylmuramate dehydrogenase [Candidatus Liptonbacteria bacterium]|nr:UDP-N-acetylmuramate dehydrogenase [Candidatus Liptonbacteria bacterium]
MPFKENVSLKNFSNYKIGGEARYFLSAGNLEELVAGLRDASEKNLAVFVLAGGTNILVSDKGFGGAVIKPEIKHFRRDGNRIIAGAGVLISELLDFAAKNNLSGLEWAGGLPGTLGGAIRGNAGAFGGEIKDSIKEVLSVSKENFETIRRNAEKCEFEYRSSIFKRNGQEVIAEATLELVPGAEADIRKLFEEKINYRKERQPLEYPNIGSIFKNVPLGKFSADWQNKLVSHIKKDPFPVIPTAVLISRAELKGKRVGNAQISEKHSNFIVNLGGASAEDVLALISFAKSEIQKVFNVLLEEEIEII